MTSPAPETIERKKDALSIREISERHGICADTVYAEINRKRLRKSKIGRRTVIFWEDYEEWRRLCRKG